MELDRIVVITRQTRLEESVRRFATKQQAKFFVKSRGQSFDDYELEHGNYLSARDDVGRLIPRGLTIQFVDRNFLPNFLFGPGDVVVVLGQDGLVVNAAKYLEGQPVVAVNPDPERFDGVLLPFRAEQIPAVLDSIAAGKFKTRAITMGRVDLNDGQHLYAFNDFFVGVRNHTSARYTIRFGESVERHSSSGVIVSTPAGSTGWLSSVFNMANGLGAKAGRGAAVERRKLAWEERRLIFVVREPFESKWSAAGLVTGENSGEDKLVLESHMAESGTIFSDGVDSDFLEFNSGAVAGIGLAEKTTSLVVQ